MPIDSDLRTSAMRLFESLDRVVFLKSLKKTKFCILLIVWALCSSLLRGADELMNAPFALRFPAAFTHFSPFADVAAKGGASAASPFGSSSNLAGIAWSFQPQEFDYLASANYDFLTFDSGTELHLSTQTLAFDVAELGVFRWAMIEFQSNRSLIRTAPVHYEFELLGTRLDWSKRFGDFGLGAGLGFTRAETLFSTATVRLADSEKDNWTGRLSIQRQWGQRWLIGATADYGLGRTEVLRESVPGVFRRSLETSQQWMLQTGLAYLITPKTAAHLDYQYAHLTHEAEELAFHRCAVGTDIPVLSWLILRTGGAVDQWGNLGFSGGLAWLPRRGATVNLAYQNGMFPVLDREFGNAQMFNLSVSLKW